MLFHADVNAKGTDSPQALKDSSKPAGTGFFLPLAMRSSGSSNQNDRVNSRNKPCRRRNISTPNIGLSNVAGDRNVCSSLRSNSSSNLRSGGNRITSDGHPRRFSMSIEEECAADYADHSRLADVQAGSEAGRLTIFPASSYNEHAATVAAALAASSAGQASRVVSMQQQLNLAAFTQLPPGLEQPMQQTMQQTMQQSSPQGMVQQRGGTQGMMQQQLRAVATSTSPRSCGSSSSSIGLQEPGNSMAALSARLAAPQEPPKCSTPICPDALQTFYGPGVLQPVPAAVDVPADGSSSDIGSLLLLVNSSGGSSSKPGLAEVPVAATASSTVSSSLGQRATPSPPPAAAAAAAAASSPHILSQVSLSTWAVPEVPSGAAAAATESLSFDTISSDVEENEEMIQKRIDELLLQKQLLKLRQQHKQQQALLQLQQEQQEQALQQQLQMLQSGQHKAPQKRNSEPLLLQQQVLQVQLSNESFTGMQSLQQQQQQQQQVQRSNGSFSSMHLLQQQPQQEQQQVLQVQLSNGSFTSMQSLQQQQQQQQQVQRSNGSFTSMQLLQQQPKQEQQQVLLSNGSFTSMQSLQQQPQQQVQSNNNFFTELQILQQQQQQQQDMLQSQHSGGSSAEQKPPEQLQRQLLQLQLQQLQLQQQQQRGASASPSGMMLLQGAMSAPQPLTSAVLMVNAGSSPACNALLTQLQPNPNPNGTIPIPTSSSALSAFASSASAGQSGFDMLQGDVMPGNGSSYADYGARIASSAAAGTGPAGGLASWGSGHQLNLGGADGGSAAPSYTVLFGGSSGQAAATDGIFAADQGPWSFDAGLTFGQ
jgi:hypothetical protein